MFDRILDPTGLTSTGPANVATAARRVPTLKGARVGLLNNTKQNAKELLAEIGKLLESRYGAMVTIQRTKPHVAFPVDEPQLQGGRRGRATWSSSASATAARAAPRRRPTASLFEREGIPTAVIVSRGVRGDGAGDGRGARRQGLRVPAHPAPGRRAQPGADRPAGRGSGRRGGTAACARRANDVNEVAETASGAAASDGGHRPARGGPPGLRVHVRAGLDRRPARDPGDPRAGGRVPRHHLAARRRGDRPAGAPQARGDGRARRDQRGDGRLQAGVLPGRARRLGRAHGRASTVGGGWQSTSGPAR